MKKTDMEILDDLTEQIRNAQGIIRNRLDNIEPLQPGELGTLAAIVTSVLISIEGVVKHAEVGTK